MGIDHHQANLPNADVLSSTFLAVGFVWHWQGRQGQWTEGVDVVQETVPYYNLTRPAKLPRWESIITKPISPMPMSPQARSWLLVLCGTGKASGPKELTSCKRQSLLQLNTSSKVAEVGIDHHQANLPNANVLSSTFLAVGFRVALARPVDRRS